jgi:hypothetical protein
LLSGRIEYIAGHPPVASQVFTLTEAERIKAGIYVGGEDRDE